MTTTLAIRDDLPLSELGQVMVKSGFFSDASDAAKAIVKILAGRELGFGPIASMTGVNIIKGRVSLSANLIAASVLRSGRYKYRVVTPLEKRNVECEIAFYEGKEEIGRSRFTMEDAKRAGLDGGENYRRYPSNLLFARAISNGAKWYCPDIFGGPVYTPDELGAVVDGETGEVIDVPPKPEPPAPARVPRTVDISLRGWDEWDILCANARALGIEIPAIAEDTITKDEMKAVFSTLYDQVKDAQKQTT